MNWLVEAGSLMGVLDEDEAFVMDALGNRTGDQTLRDDGTVNFTVNSLTNRYTSIGANSISHDAAGNLTQDHDGYHYVYDYENRITRIYKMDGQSEVDVAQYVYDALGRRIGKWNAVAGEAKFYYHNDKGQVLAEYDYMGLLRNFVYGNYIDEPLVMSDGNSDHYYAHDHLYSTVALLDDSGSIVERYEYDAYGTTHIMDASYNPRSASAYGNPYTFTGRRLDVLDGGNLLRMHYRHRDYDTYAGRFLQHDPLGFTNTTNLYEYAVSSPSLFTDPTGLFKRAMIRPPQRSGLSNIYVFADWGDDKARLFIDGELQWTISLVQGLNRGSFDYKWLATEGGGTVMLEVCGRKFEKNYTVREYEYLEYEQAWSYGLGENFGVHMAVTEAKGFWREYGRYQGHPKLQWPMAAGVWLSNISVFANWYYNQAVGDTRGFLANDRSPFGSSRSMSRNRNYDTTGPSLSPGGKWPEPPRWGVMATLEHPTLGVWFVSRYTTEKLKVDAQLRAEGPDHGIVPGIVRTLKFSLPGQPID